MTRDVMAELVQVLRETFENEELEITRATVAGDIPGWDSLSNTLVMMSVENHFNVVLTGKKFANVGDLADTIEQELGR